MANEMVSAATIEQVLIAGDLKALNQEQRVAYYKNICESLGLNPLTKPFDYITLNGKLTLYAKRDATDQLRAKHSVSVRIVAREHIEGVYVVTARATLPGGREDESTGAVNIGSLKGDALANAMMKAETKAKRRVTLSVVGLGFLDETEVGAVPNVRPADVPALGMNLPATKEDGEIIPDAADQIDRIESFLHNKLEWEDGYSALILQRDYRVKTVAELSQEQLDDFERKLINTFELRQQKRAKETAAVADGNEIPF